MAPRTPVRFSCSSHTPVVLVVIVPGLTKAPSGDDDCCRQGEDGKQVPYSARAAPPATAREAAGEWHAAASDRRARERLSSHRPLPLPRAA